MMSAPLLTPADAELFAEASYSFSLAVLKAIDECKAGRIQEDCIPAKTFFPAGSAEFTLLSPPKPANDPAYMIKTSRLVTIYNELTTSKPDLALEPVEKVAGQEHWLRINIEHRNSAQLNFGIPMSAFARVPTGSSDAGPGDSQRQYDQYIQPYRLAFVVHGSRADARGRPAASR